MILFQSQSRGNTKKAWLFFGVFMALSLLGFLFMNVKPESGLIAQMVFIFSLIAAVYILVRYVTNAYVYEVIDEGEDGVFFLAVRLNGKKMLTQCKLSLASLAVITQVGAQLPPKTPVSNFSPLLLCESDTLLYFKDEKILARVALSKEFLSSLRALVPDTADTFVMPSDEKTVDDTRRHGPYDLSDLAPQEKEKPQKKD